MTIDAMRDRIDFVLAPVKRLLGDIGTQLRALQDVGMFGRGHEAEMMQQLEAVARRALTEPASPMTGVGVAWTTGGTTSVQSHAGMLWWMANGGDVTRKIHVANPDSDSFYDFLHTEWYERAVETPGLVLVGPFIDAWGTDDHTLTASVTVVDRAGRRLGVAAADLDVSLVTAELAAALGAGSDELHLVDDEDRIVATNSPVLTPGLRLSPYVLRRRLDVQEVARATGTNWRVVRTTDL